MPRARPAAAMLTGKIPFLLPPYLHARLLISRSQRSTFPEPRKLAFSHLAKLPASDAL